MKEQGKTSEENLYNMEISNLPDKEVKILIIGMITKLGRRMDDHSENFNKERKYKKIPNRIYRVEEYNY